MENCALCGKKARMFCESDQAKLCWDCDDKVHGANFLVAKHTRVLLCRTCQSFTPWKASGPKLTPTHSLCNHCATNYNNHQSEAENHHDLRDSSDRDEIEEEDGGDSSSDAESGYEDDDEEEDEEEEEEEEGENQVVPWSPPLASSASANCSGLPWKRRREGSIVDSDDEIGCSSSEMPSVSRLPEDDSSSWSILRPWKHPRTTQQN